MNDSPLVFKPPEMFGDRLRRARDGSPSALGQLMVEVRNYLLLVANQELDDQLCAKLGPSDLVQDTLAQAQMAFPGFLGESEGEFRVWMVRILQNQCHNIRTAFMYTAKRELNREVPWDDGQSKGCLNGMSEPGKTPSGHAIANEEARLIEQILNGLPPVQCQVVRWRAWESLSFDEIGQRIGRSPSAAQ